MLQGLGLHLVRVPPPAVGRVYLGQLPQERPAVDEALLAEHDHGVGWLTGLGANVCRDLNQMFHNKVKTISYIPESPDPSAISGTRSWSWPPPPMAFLDRNHPQCSPFIISLQN